ncbi:MULTISPECIES: hypothetical protein [Natrialbaceae]|uniref:hypothetical protein n=1 Tax=Natrialbaceae TaxID=1644061 RepID=UPI00207C9937|nr:hypothetical protein [Natronococcus sp. CG52]
MGRSTSVPTDPEQGTAVACPQCDERVAVSVPDNEVEPTASPSVAAFGDHSVVHCPAGHKFWVNYC